MANRTFLGAPP